MTAHCPSNLLPSTSHLSGPLNQSHANVRHCSLSCFWPLQAAVGSQSSRQPALHRVPCCLKHLRAAAQSHSVRQIKQHAASSCIHTQQGRVQPPSARQGCHSLKAHCSASAGVDSETDPLRGRLQIVFCCLSSACKRPPRISFTLATGAVQVLFCMCHLWVV